MGATDGANPTNLTDNAAAIDFDPEYQPVPRRTRAATWGGGRFRRPDEGPA